ncbi:phosphatidate cytidylyltransferase [Halomonas huangheensis]|uniref:phosphatidate cytidylyltransferase n=1 Tax=Halomonas huangheensis TaxID=1178482 RepID=UPI0004CE74FC|nr:phosphatidate cytidylyltransferase [Halomonas huangheensis]ALM51344.1 phosphatidate cytidylyltransferase [Halomonas huangheensis]
MLRQRVITAAWLAPLALLGLFGLQGGAFAAFTAFIVLLAGWEWGNLSGLPGRATRGVAVAVLGGAMLTLWLADLATSTAILAVGVVGWVINLWWVTGHPERQAQWSPTAVRLAMGLWVLLPTWVGFNLLRESGAVWLLFVLLVVWGADIGAYFCGRAFGRRKLAPKVSPAKSWEGVYGGMAVTASLAVAFALAHHWSPGATLLLVVLTLIVTMASVLGDLLESMLKRHRGIKDSSQLLPGHGGVMDRIDSLTAAVPCFALFFSWLVSA